MFKKRLKGLLAMVLAGSIAATALPLTASAEISDNYVDVCEANRYNSKQVPYYELQKDESVSPYLNENNLWGVYYSYSYYDTGYTPAKELSATGTEAFSGDMLEGKFDGFADTNINDYSDIRITAQHKYIVTTDDPSATKISAKSALTTSTFPVEIPLTDYVPSANPLMDYSFTPWYSTTDAYGDIYSEYAVQSTDEPVRFSAGDESISIGMDTFKGLYSADIHTGNQNDAIEIFLNGITILQLKPEYKTLDIPVLNGLGTQQIKGGNPYTLSVTGGLSQYDYLESFSNYFYVGYTNKNGEVVLSDYPMNNKQAAWAEIEAFATKDPNFDVNKLFFLRPLNVWVNKDSSEIGSFTSKDLLLAKNASVNLPEAYKYIVEADDNSLWKLPLKFVSGKDLLKEIETYLNKVPDIGSFSLTETTEIMVTGTKPVSCEINQDYEMSPESYEISPLYVKTVPATISDHAAVLEKAGALEAGNIFDTSGWQLWGCGFRSGGVDEKLPIWKFKESDLESTNGVSSIGIDQLNTLPIGSYPLLYFPQVKIAPSLEVTAPVAGETPSFDYTIKDTVGRYTVFSVEWSCGNTLLSENDKFEAGKEYTVKIELWPDGGLSFVDSTPVTINGEEADTYYDYDIGFYASRNFTIAPEIPFNVKATAGNGKVDLKWDYAEGAYGYTVNFYNEDGTLKEIAKTQNNSYTVENLENGKEYGFVVISVSETGENSSFTKEDVVYATPVASTVPQNVKATAGVESATLTWDAVQGATKYAIAYQIGSAYKTLTLTCVDTKYTAENLTAGTTYKFIVQAYVDGKWSPFTTADLVAVTPIASTKPQNVKATAGVESATLTWDAVQGATKYAIAYQSGVGYKTLTLACTDTKYTAKNLTAGTTYKFLVQAYVDGKWSPFTTADLVAVTPISSTKPQNVKATAGVESATLTWDAVQGATKYAIAYKIGSAYKTLTLTCVDTKYTAENLTAGTTYKFIVQAYVNGKWSTFTAADLVSVTPTASTKPTNIKATVTSNSATLTWDAVQGATKYAIAYQIGSAYKTLTLTCVDTKYTAENLTAGTTYKFIVQAYVNGKWSTFTAADLVSVTPTASTKPTNIKATVTSNSATLTWDAVQGATKYAIAYQIGSAYKTLTLTCVDTKYTAENLTAGTTYKFIVQAYVNGKWSTFTAADLVSVTPTASTKPTNIKATVTSNSATLTWDTVQGATKYAIAYKIGSAYKTLTLTCVDTKYTAENLTAGTTYKFIVQAYVNGKWSTFTAADLVSVTPTASTKPTNIKATVTSNSATLTWDAVQGATKYAIAYQIGSAYKTLTLTCVDTKYTAENLTAGTTYKFLVQAYVNGKWSTFTNADLVSVTPVA